jgi:anionic cell wall polymer biosynthesis LytR-Cps2A-Psr (LCP) family protein
VSILKLIFGILVMVWVVTACSATNVGQNLPRAQVRTQEVIEMSDATSPSGDNHPGEILFEDKIEGRQWSKQAAEVPQTIAWVNVNGVWQPVTRIEITGTVQQRRISKFGKDGTLLESTIQAPPPR